MTDSEREKCGKFYEIFFGTIWLGSHYEILEKPPYVFLNHLEQESYSFSKNCRCIIVLEHFLSKLKRFYDCGTKIELTMSVLVGVQKYSKRPSHVATGEISLFELGLQRNHSSQWGDIYVRISKIPQRYWFRWKIWKIVMNMAYKNQSLFLTCAWMQPIVTLLSKTNCKSTYRKTN